MIDQPTRKFDANLLPVLQALVEERNLTRAGIRLSMSQPAVSGALSRLRRLFDDELLVRDGRGFALTPRATELRPLLASALTVLDGVLDGSPGFSADTTTRTFSLTLSEYAMTVVAGPLVRALTERAPHIDVDFRQLPMSGRTLSTDLLGRDLVIGPVGTGIPGLRQPLFTDEFVCLVARTNRRLVAGRLTLEDLADLEHAVARFGPGGSPSVPDQEVLQSVGIDRSVRVTVPGLLLLPISVARSELCAFVPRRLARRCLATMDLVIAETPLPRISMVEAAHWHSSKAEDPGLKWLRGVLHDVAVTLEDEVDE